MKVAQVRCWKFTSHAPVRGATDQVFATYPEGNAGYDLMSCLNCGQVYAVDMWKMVYVGPPLKEKIRDLKCIRCTSELTDTANSYPDKYRSSSGTVLEFAKPDLLPDDETSLVVDFPSIY